MVTECGFAISAARWHDRWRPIRREDNDERSEDPIER